MRLESATLVIPVQPIKVRSVSIPTAAPDEAGAVDLGALGHDDPRWGPAELEAAAKAKAARATAAADPEPPLAFAAPDASPPVPNADGDRTAAIAPTAILPKPIVEDTIPDVEPDASATEESGRSATIARAGFNMRSSPRSGSKVIRVLPAGVNVGLYSRKGWCEVTYQGSRGFIYKSFLQGGGARAAAKFRAVALKAAAKKPEAPLREVTQR